MSGAKKYDFSAFEDSSNKEPEKEYNFSAFDDVIKKKDDGKPLENGGQEKPVGTSPTKSPSQSQLPKVGWEENPLNPLAAAKQAEAKKATEPVKFVSKAPPVNVDNIKKYETAQQMYNLADKTRAKVLSKDEHSIFSPAPLIEDIGEALIPGYAENKKNTRDKEIAAANQQFEATRKNAMDSQAGIKDEIPKILSPISDNWSNYISRTIDNVPKLDEYKIRDFANKTAKEYGVQENGMFYNLIKREASNLITQKLIQPEVDRQLKINYKKTYGRDLDADLKSESNQAAIKLEEIKTNTKLAANKLQNQISSDARNEVTSIQTDISTQVNALNEEIKIASEGIKNKYSSLIKDNKFIGTPDEYAQYQQDFAILEQKQKENKEAFDGLNRKFLDEQNLIFSKANARYRREAEELSKIAQSQYEKFKPKANPQLQKNIEKIYNKSYQEVLNKNEELRKTASYSNSLLDNLSYNLISSTGNYIKGLAESAGLESVVTFGEFLQNTYAQDVTEFKSAKDYLDLQKLAKSGGQLIGGMLPGMIGAAAVTAASGGAAAPVGWQLLSAGLTQWGIETMSTAGNMKADVLAATGDIAKANNAERQTVAFQKDILPLYAFSGLPFIGKGVSKIISKAAPAAVRATSPTIAKIAGFAEKKWVAPIIGGIAELVEETPQEYSQRLSEEAIRKEGTYANMFDYHTKEKFENTILNIAPMFLFGGAGEMMGQSEETKKQYAIQQAAKSFALKTDFANLAPGQKEQFLFDVMQRQGAPFAAAYIISNYSSGQIDKATFEGLQETYAKQIKLLGQTEELGLTPVQAKLYNAFSTYHDNEKKKFEETEDPILKTIAAARMTEYQNALTNIALQKEPNYSVVTYPDNTQMVFMHSELNNALNIPAFAEAVANGDIKVGVFGDSEKLNTKVEETKKSVIAAKEEEQKIAKEEEANTRKEIENTFNVQIQDNVEGLGVEVQGLGTEEQTEQAKQALRDAGIKLREDGKENITGLPSQVGVGQEPITAESQQGAGTEAISTGGVLQTQGVGTEGQRVEGVGEKVSPEEADIENRRQEELKQASIDNRIKPGVGSQVKVGQKFNEGSKVLVENAIPNESYDPNIHGDGYTVYSKIISDAEYDSNGKLSKAAKVETEIFPDKETADRILQERYEKLSAKEKQGTAKSREINARYDAELKALKEKQQAELPKQEGVGKKVTQPTTSPTIVNVSNKTELSNLEERTKTDKNKSIVLEAAKKAIATLKSIFPDMEIFIHEDADVYNKTVVPKGGTKNSRGNFAFERDENDMPTGIGRIDINLSNASETTVAHEVTHAILLKAFGDSPATFKQFRNRISPILRADLNKELLEFENMYEGLEVAPEEYLTQLSAILSRGTETVEYKPSTLRKIAAVINEFVAKITGGKFQPFKEEADFKNFVDFLNQIAGAIREGNEIKLDEKNNGDVVISDVIPLDKIKSKSDLGFKKYDIKWDVAVDSGINLNVPTERKELYEVVEKSGGAVVIINSDATGIGVTKDNDLLQGGIGYTFIDANVLENIGFAASADNKISSFYEAVMDTAKKRDAEFPEMKGKPVAIFVMVQTPAAMFGNTYAAEYFGRVLNKITTSKLFDTKEAKKELIEFIEDYKANNKTGKKYINSLDKLISLIKTTDFSKKESIKKLTDLLITNRIDKEDKSARFGFDIRRSFFEKFFVGVGTVKEGAPARNLRLKLKEKGYNHQDFFEEFGDKNVMSLLEGDTPGRKLADGNFMLTGFFVDPYQTKQEFIDKSKSGTYQHKQFNSKFNGIDPFVLDGKYYPDNMFPEARFVTRETGEEVPVQVSAAGSLYPRTQKSAKQIIERAKELKSKAQLPEQQKPTVTVVEQEQVIKQMKPFTDKMVDIEREFKNNGYEINTDYDNEIQVLDKKGEQVEPDELPDNLKKLAADYEKATMKLGEFDASAMEQALAESRKIVETEAEVVEPKKAELPEQKGEAVGKIKTEKGTIKSKSEVKGTLDGNPVTFIKLPENVEVVNGFYSPIEKRLAETKADKQSANKWIEIVGRGDEAKFTGVLGWLQSLPPTQQVPKSEIQNWMKDNRIEINEVIKGKDKFNLSQSGMDEVYNDINESLSRTNQPEEIKEFVQGHLDNWYNNPSNENYKTLDGALGEANLKLDDYIDNAAEKLDDTRYYNYQLPGEKTNYKEVLITLPTSNKELQNKVLELEKEYEKDGSNYNLRELENAKEELAKSGTTSFRSSHYDEPNILVHIRMNTRTDAEGNKVLHVEEFQSDWGQKGKKEGFEDIQKQELAAKKQSLINKYEDLDELRGDKRTLDVIKNMDNIRKDISDINKKLGLKEDDYRTVPIVGDGIPQAPFVTKTQDWTKLAWKVALKEAVKEGADKITWTTGEQQNERYDLSKQVDSIQYFERGDEGYSVVGIKDGKHIFSEIMPSNKLESALGKDVAKRIQNNEGKDGVGGGKVLEGSDLSVGGTGMKGFYGSPSEGKLGIVGEVAKSLFKQEPKTTKLIQDKYDSESNERTLFSEWLYSAGEGLYTPEQTQLEIDKNSKLYNQFKKTDIYKNFERNISKEKDITSSQHSIDITPEMKAQVETGLSMFSKAQKAKVDFGEGEEAKDNKKEFDKLTSTIPNSGEVTKYLSGETIEKYEGEKPRNEQEVLAQQLRPALERGVDIIQKAKELFGDKYVENLLQYVETENLPPANKALIYVSLENDLAKQKIENPNEAPKIEKMQDLVRTKSQAFLRSSSLAINMGRLRKFAEVGYDVNNLTDRFFSSRQKEDKNKIEQALQATADDINKEAERIITEDENIKAKIDEGVKEEIQKIYENLSTEKKKTVDKRLSVLDKLKQKIFNKYSFKSKPQLAEQNIKSKSSINNIIEEGYNKIINAIKAGVEINKAINIGIDTIKENIEKTTGQKWADEAGFKNDIIEGFKAEGLIETKSKGNDVLDRLEQAKQRVRNQIESLKEQIANKERTKKKDKLKPDAELEALIKQRDALTSLLNKYVPKVDAYSDERNIKAAKARLENEILQLNKQIQKGQKDKFEKKESKENAELDALRAEKEARQAILEALDPTPRLFIENALIEQGFGRQINVKTKDGVEKRWVLDWKKLAGEEGSVDNIRDRVEAALRDKGYFGLQLLRIQDSFVEEYNNLRQSIVEKAQNEIAARNKEAVTPEQKSAVKKLVEMYNYGLFDKDPAEFETALAKTIGVSGISLQNFERVKELGEAMSNLFNASFEGQPLNESELRTAIQVIEEKMRIILNSEAMQQGTTAFKLSEIAKGYMDASQRMLLNTIKQGVENPMSGLLERFYSAIGYSGKIPEQLNAQQRKMARDIYKEMVLQKGMGYGNVGNAFISKGSLDAYVHNMSDSELVQGVMSIAMGKTILDAVDSAYKAKITQQKFTYNLIKILTTDRMVNGQLEKGMSKEEAKRYVAEKISGQSFEEAKKTAKDIIDKINTQAGKKIFNDSPEFVSRLATDIVNAALINGEKITKEMVTAAYNAAYKAAGRGLGHVSNNFISEQINTYSGKLESRINDAIKQKKYNKAAWLNLQSILYRNIINPFVGGGTNWIVLKAEKTGLGLVSGLASMYSNRDSKIDMTSETGMKELEDVMYNSMKTKDKFIRGAVGGAVTALAFMLIKATDADDEYEKWIKKNQWAKKYLSILTPEIMLAMLAAKSTSGYKTYLENSFNKNESFDKGKMAMKAMVALSKGDKAAAAGQTGQLLGSSIGTPIPWRLVRDGQQIWVGATGGEPYAINPAPAKSFMEGYLKGGLVDYLGFAPTSEDKTFILTKKDLDKPEYQIYKDKEVKIPKHRSINEYRVDTETGLMNEEQYNKFISLVDSYMENGFQKIDGYREKTVYGLKELPEQTFRIKQKGQPREDVLGRDLSKEDLQNKVNQLHEDAVEQAKFDLGLITKKPKRTVTIKR